MDLKDAKIGDVYKVFINSINEMVEKTSTKTVSGTIIATKKKGHGSGFIIGWRKDQARPLNSYVRGNTSAENDYIPDQVQYVYGKTVPSSWLVASKVSGESGGGMPCRGCLNFYPYAVSNQADGTLLCWSCRTTW